MKKQLILALCLGLSAFALLGCGEDTEEETTDSQDTNDDLIGPTQCTQERADIGSGEVDAPCWEIDDCKSGKCEIFQSIPDPGDGVCAEANATNALSIQATVRDIESGELMPNVEVTFGSALKFSANPAGATPIATVTSDESGRIDFDLDTKACTDESLKLGVVARIEKEGYFLSMGGLVAPEVDAGEGIYPSALRNHDVMVVPADMLTQWSTWLAEDTAAAPYAPLGEKGGCVVRSLKVEDGLGVVGSKLQSNTNPTGSTAIVRYLNEAKDGFNATGMASHGLAVVLKPGLGEQFDAVDADGNIISIRPGTMGSAASAIYTNTLHIK